MTPPVLGYLNRLTHPLHRRMGLPNSQFSWDWLFEGRVSMTAKRSISDLEAMEMSLPANL